MTARSIRRAQERKARKLARKTEKIVATISEAPLLANRLNAQLSPDPDSKTGKAKSSLNAVDEAAVLSDRRLKQGPD